MNLWNISALVQKSLEGSDALIAARKCFLHTHRVVAVDIFPPNLVRLAAFRLVEAGLESKPGTESQ